MYIPDYGFQGLMIVLPILLLLMSIATSASGRTPARGELVRLGDVELYYEVHGQGDPLLLLHGWTQSSASWSDHVSHYAKHFRVYVVDLRGHGRSSPLTSDFSIERAAADVGALIDHLQLSRPRAIGLSYGGLVLLQLAATDPGRVGSMVIVGASHQYDGSRNSNLAETFRLENLPPEFLSQLRRDHVHGEEQIRAMFDPRLRYGIDLSREQLRKIDVPTLVVSGDRDEVMDMAAIVALYQGLPRGRLWVVPNAGHTPLYGDHAEPFLAVTTAFLEERE